LILAASILLSSFSSAPFSSADFTASAQTPNQCPRVIAKRQKLRQVCQSAKGGPEACRAAMRAIALMDQGIGRYCPSTGVGIPDPDPPGGDGPDDIYDPVGDGDGDEDEEEVPPEERICPIGIEPKPECEASHIKDSHTVTLKKNVFVNNLAKRIDSAFQKLPPPLTGEFNQPKITGTYTTGEACCDQCNPETPLKGKYHQLNGKLGVSGTVGIGRIVKFDREWNPEVFGYGLEIIFLSDIRFGAFVKPSADINLQGRYSGKDSCDQMCFPVFAKIGGKLDGEIGFKHVEAQVRFAFDGPAQPIPRNTDRRTYNIVRIEDLKAIGTLEAGGLFLDIGHVFAGSEAAKKLCGSRAGTCQVTLGGGGLKGSIQGKIIFGQGNRWWNRVKLPSYTFKRTLWKTKKWACEDLNPF